MASLPPKPPSLPTGPKAPNLLKKQKFTAKDFAIVGLILNDDDLPTGSIKAFTSMLLGSAYTGPGASQVERFQTNVAVMLRVYDFFYDLQKIQDFWVRLRQVTSRLWGHVHMEAIVKRYVNARRRYLTNIGSRSKDGEGMQLVIVNLTDKLISKTSVQMEKKKPTEEDFDRRAKAWANQSRNLGALFGRLRSRDYDAHYSSTKSTSTTDVVKDESVALVNSEAEGGPRGTQGLPPTAPGRSALNHSTATERRASSPSSDAKDGRTWPPTPNRPEYFAWSFENSAQEKAAKHGLSEKPVGATGIQESHAQERESPMTPKFKRPAAADFVHTSSKRQAVQEAVGGDRLSPRAASIGSFDAYSPTSSFAGTREQIDRAADSADGKDSIMTTYDTACTFGSKEGSAGLRPQSRSLEQPIALPSHKDPIVARYNTHLQRLQRELRERTEDVKQLQGALKQANESAAALQQRNSELEDKVLGFKEEKAALTMALKGAEDKLGSAAAPLSTPATNSIEMARQLMLKQFVARRDYKGLLSHIAAELPRLAKPIVSSLRQETDDEENTVWKALENVWIALDWAEKQASENAESL